MNSAPRRPSLEEDEPVTAAEIILPFPAPRDRLGRSTHIRSTLLASSIQSLRTRGLFERYRALLPNELREEIVHSIAGEWLAIDLARTHYGACDRLGMTHDEQVGMGRDVSARMHETFLGLVVKMARGAGVTPWALLPRGNALYGRVFRGGGTQVTKLGPTEARVDIRGLTLMDISYFRHALLGMYEAGLGMFADQVNVRMLPESDAAPGTLTVLRAQWAD